MKSLRKVVWAEGMFLGQQHFQLWDQYYEAYHSMHARSISPMSWGLLNLEIDEEAMENAQFRISQCQIIFPDGRLVSYDAAEDDPLIVDLEGGYSDRVELFLCMPSNRSTSGINGYRDHGQLCAWNADYRRVTDENDPGREREVMLGKANLMLLTGEEARESFTWIKIAEIVNEGEGEFSIVENFIPPVARIGASEYLRAMLLRYVETFSAKIRVLNERRRQFSSGIAEFGHSDLSNFLILQTLSGAIPMLEHYRENDDLHPEQVYLLLSNIYASLVPFSFELDVHSVPKYRHTNLSQVFNNLERILKDLLDLAMPTKMAPIKLVKETEILYSVDNIDSTILANSTFYLAVLTEHDDPMWVGQFERMAKAGARADIEMIVASALPGIKISHIQRPPSKMPIKSGYEYFRLEPHGDFWNRVIEERTLALFTSRDFAKAKVEVVTVTE